MLGLIFLVATTQDNSASGSLISFERSFAADVAARGIKQGFLATMDEESVVFVPTPVNGLKQYEAMAETKMKLIWEPMISVVSSDGQLGFNAGPWRIPSAEDLEKSIAEGYFTSVWRKQGDRWVMVYDCGSQGPSVPVKKFDVERLKTSGRSTLAALKEADANVTNHLDAGSLLFVSSRAVARGTDEVRQVRKELDGLVLKVTKSGIAKSSDLAWSYGTTEKDGKTGGFSRCWRCVNGEWRLVAEVVLPPQ